MALQREQRSDPAGEPALYGIEQHQHYFAAWAASRAASVKGCRFKVEHGRAILEAGGFTPGLRTPDQLPPPEDLDELHERWRGAVITAATSHGYVFSHGVAAKLINCYLKSRFVCGGYHAHKRVVCLHPPIDDTLLVTLIARNVGGFAREWTELRRRRWSRFSSSEYQDTVNLIRKTMGGAPLWAIEEHWKGYQ